MWDQRSLYRLASVSTAILRAPEMAMPCSAFRKALSTKGSKHILQSALVVHQLIVVRFV